MFSTRAAKPLTLADARVLTLNEKSEPEALLLGDKEIKFVTVPQAEQLLREEYSVTPSPELQRWARPGYQIYCLRKGKQIFLLEKD
jgi:hypothetical protein